jgi:hypothetical protein
MHVYFSYIYMDGRAFGVHTCNYTCIDDWQQLAMRHACCIITLITATKSQLKQIFHMCFQICRLDDIERIAPAAAVDDADCIQRPVAFPTTFVVVYRFEN